MSADTIDWEQHSSKECAAEINRLNNIIRLKTKADMTAMKAWLKIREENARLKQLLEKYEAAIMDNLQPAASSLRAMVEKNHEKDKNSVQKASNGVEVEDLDGETLDKDIVETLGKFHRKLHPVQIR